MDELIKDFIIETKEGLDRLDNDILTLEKNPDDEEIVGNIFRVMHTIKGTCGFLGLSRLESIAHAGEDVFDKVRGKELSVNQTIISLVFKAIDQIKAIIEYLEENESEPKGDDTELITKLRACAGGQVPAAKPEVKAESSEMMAEGEAPASDNADLQALFDATESLVDIGQNAKPEVEKKEAPASDNADLQALFDATESLVDMGQSIKPEAEKKEAPASDSADLQALFDATESLVDMGQDKKAESSAAPATVKPKTEEKKEAGKKASATSSSPSIRVNLDVLEELMQKASELVLTRNQLMQILRSEKDSKFGAALHRLSAVTTELQEGVMKTRMQPIGSAWTKLPRIVRDLSESLNKQIELKMIGEETELDRQLLEMITDPLTHMIRNSADHGLESTEKRIAAGKPATGTIELRAYHGGGYIIIEIKDDGGGINPEIIKKKAIEKGLTTEAEAADMSDQQILKFIFHAGFSTAEKVTAVSGRGVGMDVVKNNIEKISGTIDLQSTLGVGTIFTIKIPLTLAIMSILQVAVNGQRFAIPQISVVEIVKAHSSSGVVIEKISDKPVLRLRENIMPLIPLVEILGLGKCDLDNSKKANFIVICEIGRYQFGVVVDEVFDTEEIVVKPVSPILQSIDVYSGSTVLGDGSVILILDPSGIAKSGGDDFSAAGKEDGEEKDPGNEMGEKASFIVFKAGDKTPKVVPLELISRLEEIETAKIEYSRGKPVIQYREGLMRIISLDNEYKMPESGMQELLVLSQGNKVMGLAVDEIVDIAKCEMKELEGGRDGFLGSMVVNGKTCDVVDVSYYFMETFKDYKEKAKAAEAVKLRKNILLIDDSSFFRKFIPPELQKSGYDVVVASSAEDALAKLEAGMAFSAIVSDLNMPGLGGKDFAKICKSNSRLNDVPIIALSSNTEGKDGITQSAPEGFDAYVSKTSHLDLINILAKFLDKEMAA